MPPLPLVPQPVSVEPTDAPGFRLHALTRIEGPADAVAALTTIVEGRTGLVLGGGRDDASTSSANRQPGIVLRLAPGGAAESYRLTVDAASVEAVAPDLAGLFYAAQTLGQLISRAQDGWSLPTVDIRDAPRFAYRGTMLDVARTFQPVEVVTAFIDRAASLKLNVLHLHLSDDQGWRLQLASRPALTERGAGSSVGGRPGGFYTRADYAAIVAHAASRHMTVVPEFDMPGHTHAVGLAYPELVEDPVLEAQVAAAEGDAPPRPGEPYTGIAVGFSSLRVRDEATFDFVADVFGELASLTPGPYLHFGGDESLGTDAGDFSAFVTRVSQLIADLGKTPVAWHEAGCATIHDDTVGQYWGFVHPTEGMDDKARAFVARGSRLILSPADAVYLDMKHDAADPLGLTWANGPTSVERAYAWDPAQVIDGIGEDDILGVEAPLWGETVREASDLDALAFPRIAAAAEIAWSPRDGRGWESFRARVGGLAPLWEARGIRFFRSPEIDWVAS